MGLLEVAVSSFHGTCNEERLKWPPCNVARPAEAAGLIVVGSDGPPAMVPYKAVEDAFTMTRRSTRAFGTDPIQTGVIVKRWLRVVASFCSIALEARAIRYQSCKRVHASEEGGGLGGLRIVVEGGLSRLGCLVGHLLTAKVTGFVGTLGSELRASEPPCMSCPLGKRSYRHIRVVVVTWRKGCAVENGSWTESRLGVGISKIILSIKSLFSRHKPCSLRKAVSNLPLLHRIPRIYCLLIHPMEHC